MIISEFRSTKLHKNIIYGKFGFINTLIIKLKARVYLDHDSPTSLTRGTQLRTCVYVVVDNSYAINRFIDVRTCMYEQNILSVRLDDITIITRATSGSASFFSMWRHVIQILQYIIAIGFANLSRANFHAPLYLTITQTLTLSIATGGRGL